MQFDFFFARGSVLSWHVEYSIITTTVDMCRHVREVASVDSDSVLIWMAELLVSFERSTGEALAFNCGSGCVHLCMLLRANEM